MEQSPNVQTLVGWIYVPPPKKIGTLLVLYYGNGNVAKIETEMM